MAVKMLVQNFIYNSKKNLPIVHIIFPYSGKWFETFLCYLEPIKMWFLWLKDLPMWSWGKIFCKLELTLRIDLEPQFKWLKNAAQKYLDNSAFSVPEVAVLMAIFGNNLNGTNGLA